MDSQYPILYQNDVNTVITFYMGTTGTPATPVLGLTPTVRLVKHGSGSFTAPVGPVTEIGAGWYRLACGAADLNTPGEMLFHATGTGANNYDQKYDVRPAEMLDNSRLNFTPGNDVKPTHWLG
jgi:hypothetical protein